MSIKSLMEPTGIAVVGASRRSNRGNSVLKNLAQTGFKGAIFAVNPNYESVEGFACVADVSRLPKTVDCLVLSVPAKAVCDVLEKAFEHGIRAAIVLSAGFGEGGKGADRLQRLEDLANRGMAICGPNCIGIINFERSVASYSLHLPSEALVGPIALISQSGGLATNVLGPLMEDRKEGFSHVISCGNQVGLGTEDYISYLLENSECTVIAVILESVNNPERLRLVAKRAYEKRVTLLFLHVGRSRQGARLVQSHTGGVVQDADVLAAFLRDCGIVQVDQYDEFVEAIALFAHLRQDAEFGDEVMIVAGSGGSAAICADTLADANVRLAAIDDKSVDQISQLLPQFGTVSNPLDGTGALYDDPELLPKLLERVLDISDKPVVAMNVFLRKPVGPKLRRFAEAFASAAASKRRAIVGYQYTHLGGPLDTELLQMLREASIPVLLGTQNAMRTIRYLSVRSELWRRMSRGKRVAEEVSLQGKGLTGEFLQAKEALAGYDVPVVRTVLVNSAQQASAQFGGLSSPVVMKAEAAGLLHKSDVDCVRLGIRSAEDAERAFKELTLNAAAAGFAEASVLMQPMVASTAECFIGVRIDERFGPTVSFGLGGIFIEVLNSVETEVAPFDRQIALDMISRAKGCSVLHGLRGRRGADLNALADLLVALGRFANDHKSDFKALELNPVIIGPDGLPVAVDIVVEH